MSNEHVAAEIRKEIDHIKSMRSRGRVLAVLVAPFFLVWAIISGLVMGVVVRVMDWYKDFKDAYFYADNEIERLEWLLEDKELIMSKELAK